MIRHPFCAIRRRACGLLPDPACPDSPGIRAAGAGLRGRPDVGLQARPWARLKRAGGLPLRRRRRRVARRRRALTPSAGRPSSAQGVCGDRRMPGLRNRPRWSRRARGQTVVVWGYCPYGDPRRVGICEAWAAVHGLRGVGLRTLRFFVDCRRAADAYGAPPARMGNGNRVKNRNMAAV